LKPATNLDQMATVQNSICPTPTRKMITQKARMERTLLELVPSISPFNG